jgi:hypothetical protein
LQTLGKKKGIKMIAIIFALSLGAVIGVGGVVLLLYIFAD